MQKTVELSFIPPIEKSINNPKKYSYHLNEILEMEFADSHRLRIKTIFKR